MDAEAVAEAGAVLGRGLEIEAQAHALLLDAQSRDAGEGGGLDAAHARLQQTLAAPAIDQRAGALRHAHGVRGEQVELDLQIVQIADGQKRAARLHEPRGKIGDVEHGAGLRRDDLDAAASRLAPRLDARFGADELRPRAGERGAVQVELGFGRRQALPRQVVLGLHVLEHPARDGAALGQRAVPLELGRGVVEGGAGALDIGLGQAHGGLGLGHRGLGLQAGAGVEERRIGGLDHGDDTLAPGHRVAHLHRRARGHAGERRGDRVGLAHPRHPLGRDGDLQGPARDLGHVHRRGFRPDRPDQGTDKHHPPGTDSDHAQRHHRQTPYCRAFSAVFRSTRSSRRRTRSAAARLARTTAAAAAA
jgi:hypothetical protein